MGLEILSYKKDVKDSFIYFEVHFKCEDDPKEGMTYSRLFDDLGSFYETVGYSAPNFSSRGPNVWIHGMDMLQKEDDHFIFAEYFSRCATVEAIISDIETMYFDKEYSVGSTRPYFFKHLILSLSNFWD